MFSSIPVKLRLCVALASLCMAASSAWAQDCLTPAAGDLYVNKDAAGASDSNNGVLTSEGGTGPFMTIQKLVNTIRPGQCGWVRATRTPYTETGKISGQPISGITFTRGGSSEDQRVIVSGYPGETPVIDQQRITPSGSWGLAGFLIASGNYITIRGFEIVNASYSSIHVADSAFAERINIENNHLHHTYSTENAGGVRLDNCNYCIVRNNRIHHHYRTFAGSTSNMYDSVPYGLNSGVHGFQPGNCIIENNLIYNVDKGIQLKQADTHGLDAHSVSGNIFVNMSDAAYNMQLQGAGMAPPRNARFFNNIVYMAPVAVYTDLSEANAQATSLRVYNNTLINVPGGIVGLENFTGVEVYNNLLYGTTSVFSSRIGQGTTFFSTQPLSWRNAISYFDNNLYFNAVMRWNLGRDTSSDRAYSTISEWRAASHPELSYSNPDRASIVADPRFVNAAGGSVNLLKGSSADYALASNSPALNAGRSGVTIGAVRTGVTVGLLDGDAAQKLPPVAPSNLTIEVE